MSGVTPGTSAALRAPTISAMRNMSIRNSSGLPMMPPSRAYPITDPALAIPTITINWPRVSWKRPSLRVATA